MASAYKGGSRDLRIVLLGVSGAGKSPTANAILGREAFKESRTRESEIQRGRVEDRNISIIDTPGFFNTQLTDEELQKQMMKSLDLCHPGPHVFLLVINLETFEKEERNIVEEIQEIFGAQAFKFTIVLFTGRDKMTKKAWMVFIVSPRFQELVSHFRGQYHAINSTNEIDQIHITKLLEKIDEVVKQNNGQHYDISVYLRVPTKMRKENKVEGIQEQTIHFNSVKEKCTTNMLSRCSAVPQENVNNVEEVDKELVRSLRNTVQKSEKSEKQDQEKKQTIPAVQNRHVSPGENTELRIVMVGKTGAGKSATGNSILGQQVFKEDFSSESVTKICQQHQQTVEGRNISVTDTPGLCDTKITDKQLKEEIAQCLYMSVPGPHVFLLVIRLDVRFTNEEKNTVEWIQENFGEKALRYTIVLFTRGDMLETSIEEFLLKNSEIRELVEQCKGGYHVFNNRDVGDQSQVSELVEKMERMVKNNGGEHYTNEMFQDAQRQKKRREEEERNRVLSKVKDATLLGTGIALGAGAAVAATGVMSPAVMVGVAAAGGAALVSTFEGATLSESVLAAGNAVASVARGESLPSAILGERAKKPSYS